MRIGPSDRADALRDALLDAYATTNESDGGLKITKREINAALPALGKGVKLDAASRMAVWAKMDTLRLTAGAKQALAAAIGPHPEPSPAGGAGGKVAADLEKKARGLVLNHYATEASDEPFRAFHKPAPGQGPVTAATFRAALHLPSGKPVTLRSADEFFTAMQDPDAADAADRAKYKAIETAMRAGLKDLQVALVGDDDEVEGMVYIFGRASDGSLAGLQAKRIWT